MAIVPRGPQQNAAIDAVLDRLALTDRSSPLSMWSSLGRKQAKNLEV